MTDHGRIREIFLRPQGRYSLQDAAHLLGYSHEEILRALTHGDIALEPIGDIPRIPWEEVALAAAERWPQDVIEAALGEDVGTVMPELVRLTDLQVRVLQYGLIVLGRMAQHEGTTINEIVARQLLDLAVSEVETLERSVSGLGAAMRWPLP